MGRRGETIWRAARVDSSRRRARGAGVGAGRWDRRVGAATRERASVLGERELTCGVEMLGRERKGGGPVGLGRAVREKGGVGRWAEFLGFGFGFFFLFLFSFLFPLNSKLFEFKFKFEFKTLALNQIKQCTSMNAQACLNLKSILIAYATKLD